MSNIKRIQKKQLSLSRRKYQRLNGRLTFTLSLNTKALEESLSKLKQKIATLSKSKQNEANEAIA